MRHIQDWRPIIRRVFAGIWCYVGFLVAWGALSLSGPGAVPEFAWVWVWVPFQWIAATTGAWFLLVASAWFVQEVSTTAQAAATEVRGAWARLSGRGRLKHPQAASGGALVPSLIIEGPPQDATPTTTLAQLVFDHMLTRPVHGGRAEELLEEMKEAGLFAIAGVPEPVDAADFSNKLTDQGWPKLTDKRRPGYPGLASGFRHVEQIEWGDVAFQPTP